MGLVTVDDTSSAITYGGGWVTGGSEHELGGTTHGTNLAGSTATVRFTGSSITIYGSVSAASKSAGAVSTYNLDGGSPVTYTGSPSADDTYGIVFYTSPQLSYGDHTLVITTQKAGAQYWLDYFTYNPDDAGASNSATTAAQQSSSPKPVATQNQQATATKVEQNTVTAVLSSTETTTVAIPNGTGSGTAPSSSGQAQVSHSTSAGSNNPTAIFSLSVSTIPGSSSTATIAGSGPLTTSSSNAHSAMSTGPIVGIALGAVALVAAVLLLFWILLRRRKRSALPASALYNSGQVEAFPPPSIAAPVAHLGTSDSDFRPFHKDGGQVQASHAAAANSSAASEAGTSETETLLAARYGASKGQQVLVVYEPYPTEAPPGYQHRHGVA